MKEVIRSQILRAILLLIAICLISFPAQAQYGGGSGTAENPYQIYTAEQMNAIGANQDDWDKHFKLMADIDLSSYTGTDFNIIGYWVGLDSPENRPFRGVFDGNGFTISNFTYATADANHIGLFGYIEDPDAEIKNLGLIDPNIDAGTEGWGVGSLAGYLREGTITGCYVKGGSISGNEDVGGLVGDNWNGEITNCYSNVSVSGNENVGGLVGFNIGIIKTCYSAGNVEGNVEVGGLVGFGAGIITSFWDVETSGQLISFGGIGRTTTEMQTASTFVGWSFGSVWTIDEGKDYPRLWWEKEQGEKPETQQLSDFLTGAGTKNDPYLIYTAEQLNMIGIFPNDWDKHFKLMADIDMAGLTGTDYNFIGIGTDNPFSGVFNGNGRKISNFTYTSTKVILAGLFGYVNGASAQIKNLGLIEPKVHTGTDGWSWGVGALAGWLEEGTITNCYVEGGSVSGNEDVGGLVGSNQDIITNCYANCVVDCNSGGGLVGINWTGEIINCYSKGSISGKEWVGGLAGFNLGTITNCYSVCSVTANDMVGGLAGENYGDIIGSFWDTQTSGQLTSDGGTGKTTVQMQMESTFTNAGWDFVDIWRIFEGFDYPCFMWEKYGGGTGEPNNPYLIYTAEQMNTIGLHEEDWDKHFRLMAEIDLSSYTGTDFNIIGNNIIPFSGFFDGNGYRLLNFTYHSTEKELIGLFDYIRTGLGSHIAVQNLGLVDPNIEAGNARGVGALVGELFNGIIRGCYVEGGCVSGYSNVGGLVGWTSATNMGGLERSIVNCYTSCQVSGNSNVGGIAGNLLPQTCVLDCQSLGTIIGKECVGGLTGYGCTEISRCYTTARVIGKNKTGGLVGMCDSGNITACAVFGNVDGESDTGGLVGRNIYAGIVDSYSEASVSGICIVGGLVGSNHGTVSNCYAAGLVNGESQTGGMIGSPDADPFYPVGSVRNSFWDIEASGQIDSAGGMGKTKPEMQTASTFIEVGWDFVGETTNGTDDIWWIDEEQDYPRLWWENE